jgi:hypothetical protein
MSDNIESNSRESDLALLQKHVEALGEHFDTVQIFCTRHMPAELDGTVAVNRASGNWHARFGQINEWVIYEKERIRECARTKRDEE